MVFNGNGLDVDKYVQRAYIFVYSDCIEVGPVACLPEPPDPNEFFPSQSKSLLTKAGTATYSISNLSMALFLGYSALALDCCFLS
nr:calpain-type cysteine protease dek1 [Quercus suber]